VHVVIPGMRKQAHVLSNVAASDAPPLPASLMATLKKHRWVRTPKAWSG
jgi:aryl-alcohol dehydrogenase-like predicted oxidoreductase